MRRASFQSQDTSLVKMHFCSSKVKLKNKLVGWFKILLLGKKAALLLS